MKPVIAPAASTARLTGRADLRAALPAALLALLPAALLTACGAAAGTGADLDEVPELALEEVFRVGSVDDPDAGFNAPGAMELDAEGNLYVFENQDMEIRVLDASGARVTTFGRRGQGPGEFGGPGRMGVVGDTVWVVEGQGFNNSRVSFFTRGGEHLNTRSVDASLEVPMGNGFTGMLRPHTWRRDGTLEGDISIFMRNRASGDETVGPPPGAVVRVPRIRFDLEGNVVDTIGFSPRPAMEPGPDRATIKAEGRTFDVPRPPGSDPRRFMLADGQVTITAPTPTSAADASLAFTRTGLAGDTLHHRAFNYTPEEYTGAFLDSLAWREAVRNTSGGLRIVDGQIQQDEPLEDPTPVARALRAAIDFPAYAPPVRTLVGGRDGSAWIQWTDDGALRDRWLILAPDGEPRGRFTLPRNARIQWASGNDLVVIERDDFDIPWVVRYRIQR